MLYSVPAVAFNQKLIAHRYETMAEENALKQARASRIFPAQRSVNPTIRLKNGKVLGPRAGGYQRALSGLRDWQMQKSSPYLGRIPPPKRPGVSGVTDFFSNVTRTIAGTVSTVSSIATPIESILKNNPSLIGLIRPPQTSTPNVITMAPNVPITQGQTLGVSNTIWIIGGVGLGALAAVSIFRRRGR